MELIYVNDDISIKIIEKVIATIGMFDGVHLGHDKVLKELKNESASLSLPSAVITFKEHPDFILDKKNLGYLMTFEERIEELSKYDLNYCIVFSFTKEFSLITHERFEKILKEKINVQKLVLGNDTKYGYQGKGNVETLAKVFPVKVVSDYMINGKCVHSSLIREMLASGNLLEANECLGRNFLISGNVSKGSKLGQNNNVRTANLELDNNYEYIKNGVYGVYIYVDKKKYLGICNIGHNPTFNYVERKRLEVNIFDFFEDIYGQRIKVELVIFLRDEIKFSSKEELYSQIHQDIKRVKEEMKI